MQQPCQQYVFYLYMQHILKNMCVYICFVINDLNMSIMRSTLKFVAPLCFKRPDFEFRLEDLYQSHSLLCIISLPTCLYCPIVIKGKKNKKKKTLLNLYIYFNGYTVSSTNIGTLGKYEQRRL